MNFKLLGRAPNEPLLYHNGQSICAAQVLACSVLLAKQLDECDGVINLAENRLDFIIGFLAALIAKQTTILPANNKLETMAGLLAAKPGATLLVSKLFAWDMPQCVIPALGEHLAAPLEEFCLDGQFHAVTVYTSGSTGAPKANVKTWQALVQTAQKLFVRLLGSGAMHAGSYLLGTVPSQHMYGLEMLVMLPLFNPVTGLVEQGLLPDSLLKAAQSAPAPVVLISSPIHINALAKSAPMAPYFASIISATAPLEHELAWQIEEEQKVGIWEIYGCTEAGSMATRRTIEGNCWQFLPGIVPAQSAAGCSLEIDHLRGNIALPDQISLNPDGSFALGARGSDVIKIGGKRGSIAQITAYLTEHPLVSDAYVFISATKNTRLYALVSGAASSDELKRFLALKIDDVMVPRLIRHVAQLPRNANGKIIHQDVLALWSQLSAAAEVNPRATACRSDAKVFSVSVPRTHPVFAAHFPAAPLVPGALLLTWLEQWLLQENFKVTAIKSCKFLQPVLPGEQLSISYSQSKPGLLSLKLLKAGQPVLEGQLKVVACHVE